MQLMFQDRAWARQVHRLAGALWRSPDPEKRTCSSSRAVRRAHHNAAAHPMAAWNPTPPPSVTDTEKSAHLPPPPLCGGNRLGEEEPSST
mmetsp:Transcript_33405/g.87966  ORF Transcript_33405/g.87966 Transcript_33405/m.87966 type:complete len:90 (-) Transcript_33405:734-1003(-)